MATRDVAAYLAEVKLLTGRSNNTFDSLIYEWLNDLFEMVETDPHKHWFLDKTVQFTIGTGDIGPNGAIVDMPDDFGEIYSMFLVDTSTLNSYAEVKSISENEAKKKYGPNDTGTPERFSEEGSSLRFWPPQPDQDYTAEMSYKSVLARVSAAADVNALMLNHHGIMIEGLRAKMWEALGQEDRAAGYWTKWERKWMDLRAAEVSRQLSGEIQFAPRSDVNASTESERGGNKLTWGGN